jgi:hypothetical protein
MKLKAILSTISLFLLTAVFTSDAKASEGTFDIYSTQGEDMRCYAASVQMLDRNYTILVSCRDIVYPAQGEVFSYAVWASPLESDKPIRLGTLGLGRATFKSKVPFNTLFVTTEASAKPKSPSGNVVMKGYIEPIPLLERPSTPTPVLEEDLENVTTSDEKAEQQLTTRNRVVTGLRRAGLIIFVVLVAAVGLIFVITRTRR